MKLNKFTNLEYIYNGKLTVVNAIYSHNIFDDVPLYYSDNVIDASIFKINDGDMVALVNRNYAEAIGKDILKMLLWRLRIKLLYKNISEDALDVICVKSLGIDNTISIIKLSNSNVDERINNIKDNLYSIGKLNLVGNNDFVLNV